MTDHILAAYYNVSLIIGERVERLRKRGPESGAMTTTEIATWVLGALVLAGVAYGVVKLFLTKQTNSITNTDPIGGGPKK